MTALRLLIGVSLVLAGCATPMAMRDINAVKPNCAKIDRQIAASMPLPSCRILAEKLGVARPDGRHWQIENLSIHDGSLFPTSIGANPQLSIYGLTNKLSQQLVAELTGQAATALA